MNKPKTDAAGVAIPHDLLSPETLDALIEEFVTREGTDYGTTEVPLRHKIEQVKKQILNDRAVILFDESTGTCTIVRRDDPRMKTVDTV